MVTRYKGLLKKFAGNPRYMNCPHLQSSPETANSKTSINSFVGKGFMALRHKLLSLGVLTAIAGLVLLLWPAKTPVPPSSQSVVQPRLPVSSFEFSYNSLSYLNPVLPGSQGGGTGLTIACESKGLIHLASAMGDATTLLIEFTTVLCGEANVIAERGLRRTVQYTREFLASTAAVQRATEDPALAITRSLFLHMDGGLRERWPEPAVVLHHQEKRLEGDVTPETHFSRQQDGIHWTKQFSGLVQGEGTAAGLTQSLNYEVKATSLDTQPTELGLVQLHGNEQSVTLQKKSLLARTDIEIRIQRVASLGSQQWQTLAAETQIDAFAAAPKIMTREEKDRIVTRWRQFRDGEGQQPARGASASNQDEYLELKQALRQDASLASDLADDLEDMDPDSSAFATLAGALIYSGEASALDAFVEQALAQKDDSAWQERALPMIGLAPRPTAESWKYLETMRQQKTDPELAVGAELGMGTQLKHGYQDAAFIAELKQRMQAAQTEADRLHLLDVVGNAGLEQFYPIVTAWLQNASLPLKLRIVQALRFMNRAEAETLLLQLSADPDADLALMALQCLQDRSLTAASIPVLLQLLTSARDDRMRLKILENLYAARHLDTSLLQKIRSIRQSIQISPSLAQTWDQLEKDWVDSVES